MIVVLAGLSMIACNKVQEQQALAEEPAEEQTPVVEEYTYTIAVDGDTKAYLNSDHMTWQSGDVIGWFTDKAGNSEINMSDTPRSFQVSSSAAMAAGAKIYAYAPYKAGDQSALAAPLSIPTAQDGVITDAMPMVSLPIELSSDMAASTDTPIGHARFLGLGAVIEYNVYTDGSFYWEKIKSVKFTSNSNIAGDFTIDLTDIEENSIPAPSGLSKNFVISTLDSPTTVGDSKANGIKVYQVIAPGKWSGTITVTTNHALYTYSITEKDFERGKIKPFNVNLASANATRLDIATVETVLKGHTWVLQDVKELGTSVTTAIGNKLTLTGGDPMRMSFDCSANEGNTYDHTIKGGWIQPDYYGAVSSMIWYVYTDNGEMVLGVENGFPLVCAQESFYAGAYVIKEITNSILRVEILSWNETWTLIFEAGSDLLSE